ncbi:FAD-dependent oxidoreductase [Amycolatopsis sp. NPDC054798]
MSERPQALVVGAGPVGLTAAHELARRGVRVRIVDRAAGPAVTSRALATHPRSLEIYDQMGVLDDLLPRGQQVRAFTIHMRGKRMVGLRADYSRLPTRLPFTLMVDQVITEEVLRTALAKQGVEVEWGVGLADFADTGDGVQVRLERDGEVEETSADWLVGCDGGHSAVRKKLGLKLEGDSSETWLIADAQADTALPRDSIHLIRTPGGSVMMVPFPDEGKWRLLDTRDVAYSGSGDDALVARRFSEKVSAATGVPTVVSPPTWVSVFSIQQRMVPTMRSGRCLVAGDAAHVHSPASGQGMNTGVQDAYNLAWKLAMVIDGHADEQLLDSYSRERVPVGAELLRTTKKATFLVQLKNPYVAAILPVAFGVMRNVSALRGKLERKIMGGMSALGLSYGDGPVAAGPGPRPGERLSVVAGADAETPAWQALLAQLREPGWTLVLGPDAERDGLPSVGGWLVPQVAGPAGDLPDGDGALRRALGLSATGWILTRPDGYVADRGDRMSAAAVRAVLRHAHISV